MGKSWGSGDACHVCTMELEEVCFKGPLRSKGVKTQRTAGCKLGLHFYVLSGSDSERWINIRLRGATDSRDC
jgi:hypothetical protein